MKFLDILKEIEQELKNYPSIGNVTTTIPELANVRADKFGMHLTTIDQEDVGIGDSQERFSIQSISKALTVALAFSFLDEGIWKQ
jgi:glutaminase